MLSIRTKQTMRIDLIRPEPGLSEVQNGKQLSLALPISIKHPLKRIAYGQPVTSLQSQFRLKIKANRVR